MLRALALSCTFALLAAAALAGEPPPPASSGGGAAIEADRLGDPNLDRSFLLPTAVTQPAGSLTFNDYELFFMGLTYGVTDRFQVTGTALAPLFQDMPTIALLNVKYQAYRGGSTRVALTAGLGWASEETFDTPDATSSAAFLGAVASRCLSDDCHSLASLNLSAGRVVSAEEDADGVGLTFGGSLVKRLSPRTKLLLEAASAAEFDEGFAMAPWLLVSYGLRFFSGDIAGDVGFVRPFGEDTEEFLLGIPFLNFTYRWR